MEPYFIDEVDSFEDDKIDLRRYYRVLIKRWWLILIVALAITLPWAYYLKSQPPVYEAEALIRFNNFAGTDPTLTQSRKTELSSRSFAERVVAQLGLSMGFELENDQFLQRNQVFADFSTAKNPVPGKYVLRILENGTYQLLKRVEEGVERLLLKGSTDEITENLCVINGFSFKLIKDGLVTPAEIPFRIRGFRKAVKSFQSGIRVGVDRSGTLMTVRLTNTDPNLAAEMTNRLAEVFIAASAKLKTDGIKGRRQVLEEQLRIVEQKLDESDRALKAFREKYATYLNSDQNKQINESVTLNRRKERIEAAIKTLKDLLAKKDEENFSSNGSSGTGMLNPESNKRYIMLEIARHPAFSGDATMLVDKNILNELEDSWKDIVRRYSPENLKAKEILGEIRQHHKKIEDIAKKKIRSLERDLQTTNQEISAEDRRLKRLPTQQYQLVELERNNKVLETQYLELLAKTQDAQLTERVSSEDIEILDPAIVPEFPTNRDKQKKAAFGGIVGFMFAIGFVLVLEFLDKSIKTVDDIKRSLKLPVLGTIPQINFEDVYDFQDSEKVKRIDQQLVTHDYSPTPVGEAYRALRTNLMFSKDTGKLQSLVVTSNEPGDGKSFTASNLSITLAQLRSRTLLIDSDLRRGVLHNTFGVAKEPGFSNYLTGALPLSKIINETHIPNLSLITCGSLIPNPSELLGSHQMRRFLDEATRKFELIIFDTPPLNAATDAVVIGTQVDGIIVVVRAGRTDRDLAKQKLELFNNVPARVIGIVLNATTADMAHPGYSYYHY